ncbi:methyl-accepting chemotaxis protein [Pseudoalteromonas ulvae]|uniref:Chemotaxis protein n=1 Tax=Pseudoalteromonas ulvae TaxID=107327 RepID=A0A244CSU3_PSEDV|nr:PAS domain-containing methyl-accepting chemotaxis protein [Pseudoalteromonas ulvae]OUL58687.1 chemotaxis protein [Pseudoalteromonas ulvae]
MRRNQTTINEEVVFNASEQLISITDPRGIITYANDGFCRVAGYTEDELVGKNHNIVRHPDMPKAAFKDLWDCLKAEKPWRGAVKNRCKDGRYYWVDAFVTPLYENNKLTGFQSVRTVLKPEFKRNAEQLYAAINQNKGSLFPTLTVMHKHILMITLSLIIFYAVLQNPFFALILPCLFALIYQQELFKTPQYFHQLSSQYDSVSRQVFSGEKAHSFADFHIKINEAKVNTILGRLEDNAAKLRTATLTLEQAANSTITGVQEESDQLHQVSTAVEEMVATITEVAGNTVTTAERSRSAQEACNKAKTAMTRTMGQVSELAVEVANSANSAHQLSDEAEKIGGIMQEIQGIADQTNLLALNAAIEAARAGEHGRGFSVVADEVRALSSRTRSATEQIHTSIKEIQSTLLSWSKVMAEGKQSAELCVEETRQTQQVIDSVYESITDISDLATQISTASEEQSMVANEISQNIINISELSQNNLSQAELLQLENIKIESQAKEFELIRRSFK